MRSIKNLQHLNRLIVNRTERKYLKINNFKSQALMKLLSSPHQYLFNLKTTSSAEAVRMWRRNVKEKWNYKCAYCGSKKELTIDHVVPRCKGGSDFTKNVVCCCHSCNQSKAHSPWEEWYLSQDFFSLKNYNKIINWMKPDPPQNLFAYRPRRNNAT